MLTLLIVVAVLGVILEIISLRRDPSAVEFDYIISKPGTEPGAPFSVQAVVTNKSRIPVSYLAVREIYPVVAEIPEYLTYRSMNDDVYIKKICRLKSRQRKKLIMETSIEKRGVHAFRSDSVEFGDFLGFREISRKVTLRREIVVYPGKADIPELTDTLGKFCGDIAAKRFLIRDPILTAGCREYTGREPMKEIHWPQSAHRGELMVREFDYNRQLSVCVILSIQGIDSRNENEIDECCVIARSICETLVETGIVVNFFTNARLLRKAERNIWKCEVSAGRTGALLEGLGRASGFACGPSEKLFEYALHESGYETAFIVILPTGDKQGEQSANRLRALTGQEVMLVDVSMLNQRKPETPAHSRGHMPDLAKEAVS